jgi:hypothetical protein
MHWTTDTDGVLDVPWGTILPSLSLAAGLGMSYANDPLTIYRDEGDERVRVASPGVGPRRRRADRRARRERSARVSAWRCRWCCSRARAPAR